MFYSLEAERLLDPSNEIDVFILHCVFLPKIQCVLDGFLNAWNNHPIRTERNLSPKMLWFSGLFEPLNQSRHGIRCITEGLPSEGLELYGVDQDGPLPEEDCDSMVNVPETMHPLSSDELKLFLDHLSRCKAVLLDPMWVYTESRRFIEQFL